MDNTTSIMYSFGVNQSTVMDTDFSLNNITSNSTNQEKTPHETEQCRIFRFVLYTVLCGFLCCLGFMGNSLSILVLKRDRSTPVASFLLQMMAVADNCFLLLWFIHYSIKDIFRFFSINAQLHPVWIYVRVYSFPFLYMTQMETIWLTVVVAMNRYMAVCLPYRAPSLCTIHNVYKEVIFVTVFSILYNVPRFLELTINTSSNNTEWERTGIGRDPIFQTLYIDIMYYLFTFVLPLLILAFVNTRVIIAYRATQKRKRRMTTRRADNENNITLVMIMVVAIFMLCQAPARLVQLIWSYTFTHCEEYHYYLIHISNSLEVLNSSINFLIYFTFRKRFRDILGEYYCTYGPLKMRRDSPKSLTTEGLALSEYQSTGPVVSERCSMRDSLRNALFGVNAQAEKSSADKASTTDNAQGDQNSEETEKMVHDSSSADNKAVMANGKSELPTDVMKMNESKKDEELEGVRRCEEVVSNTELVEYELSSENPVSRASSDNCVIHDGRMLVAEV